MSALPHAPTRLLPGTLRRTLACAVCGLFAGSCALEAQALQPPDGPPPTPPPNFTPQPPSPELLRRLRQEAGLDNGQDQLPPQASELFEAEDPRMQDQVGMINLPDIDTNAVLQMLEEFTGKPILRQQALPNVRLTFASREPLTRGQAILAIESLLALNGVAITEVGDDFLKAVPSAVISTQVAPFWEGSTLDATPSQKIYEKLFPLDYLPAIEVMPLLQPLMSQGSPMAFERSNLVLVTDALINLQRIERLLQRLDQPSPLQTEPFFFALEYIGARDLQDRLQRLQQGPLQTRLSSSTIIEADERTNQLIVFTHRGNEPLIRQLIQRLDVDVAPLTSTEVFSIRYAEAPDVVEIIEQVVSGQKDAREALQGNNETPNTAVARRAAAQAAREIQQANAAAATLRAEASNLQFSDFLTLVADERSNNIVASGTRNDLRFLTSLIEEIDVLLAQVRIEVIIADISLTQGYSYGLESLGITTGQAASYTDGTSGTVVRGDIGNGVFSQNTVITPSIRNLGINPLIFGSGDSILDLLFEQARTRNDVQILSAPTIVTTHNREASITVGQSVPVVSSTLDSIDGGGTSDNDTFRRNIQYRDANLQLSVTPLIGSDGVIQLEIDQSIDDVGSGEGVDGNPVFLNRSANSFLSVADGELVVLGGLQRRNESYTKNKLFLLGDIPVLGDWLFSETTTGDDRSELLIFIRPVIVSRPEDASADARQLLSNNPSREEIEHYLEEGNFKVEDAADAPEEEPAAPSRRGPRR